MATSVCIFCGKARVTKEHLIPEWMLKEVQRQCSWPGGRAGVKFASQAPHEWTITRPAETVVRCVCRRCNNEWMNDIEKAAKPAFSEMIQGSAVKLDQVTQEAIGTWMALKAILSAYVEMLFPVPQEWLTHFYTHHSPPPDNWAVYTTRYTGAHGLAADGHRIALRSIGTDVASPVTASTDQGVLASFIIGHLAIQGRGIRSPVRLHERVNIHRVWPASPLTLLWPPAAEIDDQNLDEFRLMGFSPPEKPYTLSS